MELNMNQSFFEKLMNRISRSTLFWWVPVIGMTLLFWGLILTSHFSTLVLMIPCVLLPLWWLMEIRIACHVSTSRMHDLKHWWKYSLKMQLVIIAFLSLVGVNIWLWCFVIKW
jgi:hypothetical protein